MSSLPPPPPPNVPNQGGWPQQPPPSWGTQPAPPPGWQPQQPWGGGTAAVQRSDATSTLLLGGLSILGAVMLLVGSFMSWATVRSLFGELSVSGFDGGDGKLTAAAGAGAILFLGVGLAQKNKALLVLGCLCCVGGGLVAIYDIVNVTKELSEADLGGVAQANVGVGLYICALGAVLGFVTAIVSMSGLKK